MLSLHVESTDSMIIDMNSWIIVVESVDSICRDSADTQYIVQNEISIKGKLITVYNNVPSTFECFHHQQSYCVNFSRRFTHETAKLTIRDRRPRSRDVTMLQRGTRCHRVTTSHGTLTVTVTVRFGTVQSRYNTVTPCTVKRLTTEN